MKLSEIQDEIDKDSKIDHAQLDREALNIPYLHSKYYRIYMDEIRMLRKMESDYKKLRKDKVLYYSGKAPDDDYKSAPLNLKVLKQDMEMYLDADDSLSTMRHLCELQRDKCNMIEAFIKTLNNRSFMIKNAIDFIKFKNGQ